MQKTMKAAKIIRIITIPPVMIGALLLTVYFIGGNDFSKPSELILALLFQVFMPILAYPLQKIIPFYKDKGREGQRNLAFILTGVGYTLAVIYGILFSIDRVLMFIFLVYFISVVVLTIINKVFRIKASGHACSIVGTMVCFMYIIGFKAIYPCIALIFLILWASLKLKRHTLKEFLTGSAVSVATFICCLLAF